MEKVNEYVKNLKIKNSFMSGLDKESVYSSLKELVNLFREEMTSLEEENKSLKDQLIKTNKNIAVQKNANSEIFNELSKLKKYPEAYDDIQRKYSQLQEECRRKDILLQKIKEESFKQIELLKTQNKELIEKNNNKEIIDQKQTINFIKESFQKALDNLTDEFIHKNTLLSEENNKLKEENNELKQQIEELKKTNDDEFVEEINNLYKTLDEIKSKYKKEV